MSVIIRILAVAATFAYASPALSAIVSVSGPDSSEGKAPSIIAAPANVLDDVRKNRAMQGFNEMQNVLLLAPLMIDQGVLAAGTRVNSQMIFLNSKKKKRITHRRVRWTFENIILGTMSDIDGNLEAMSSAFLGAAGTNYTTTFPGSGPAAPFKNRGLEGFDAFTILGNQLRIRLRVTEPGDWIRVITVSAVPLPAALPLFGTGLAILGLARWRRKRRRSTIAA